MVKQKLETEYKERLALLMNAERVARKKSRLYLYGKLLFFFAAVVMAYYGYVHQCEMEYVVAFVFFAFYVLVLVVDDKCVAKITRLRAFQKVYKDELAALNDDYGAFDDGAIYVDPQHEYAYDLDIFGEHSLFQRLNRTVTAIGRERLAEKFQHLPADRHAVLAYQEAIGELSEMTDWRLRFLSHPFVENSGSALTDVVRNEKYGRFILSSFLPYLFVFVTLSVLMLAIFSVVPWSMFFMMFTVQIGITLAVGRLLSKVDSQTQNLHKEFQGYLSLLEDLETAEFKSSLLSSLKIDLFQKQSSVQALRQLSLILNLFNQRTNELMAIFLNGMFLYDIFLIRYFARWKSKYLSEVPRWLKDIAEFDSLVSLGDYAFNHPQNAVAEVLEEGSNIIVEAKGVYHPFLRYNKAVPNDFTLLKSNVSIVTGANMAGKSTFLRTLGVSFVMASNGIPVCAKGFRFSLVSLFSSMRTADDLSKDISYFNAELLRLQQLVKYVKQQPYTFIILDEILKGTNSRDKLKGSVMFLEAISKCRVCVMVATHDLELSKLEDKYPETYRNYCFEIDLAAKVNYSYKIQRGVAHNLNASFLLSNILKEIG